jgi:DNA-binding NtrC family response regulator
VSDRDDSTGFEEAATALQRPVTAAPPLVGRCVLVALNGPDAQRRFSIDGSETRVLLGQSPACQVRLSDPTVSRRHAAVERDAVGLLLHDLHSTNGTFVGETRVRAAYLEPGQRVRLGSTTLRVEHHEACAPAPLPAATRFGSILGASEPMRRLYPLCERLAASNVPVVIEGETGTGKEVLAESLHDVGPRASGPFVVFDCTAMPANLMESELFGYERGAFTGAVTARKGLFEQAEGGTLLIDEIGDLDVALQPKLLRAIERSEVRRLGSGRAVVVDVRILAATRRDLDREVQLGRFRDDLFHRLAVGRVELPPLRKRRGDVAVLARHFCAQLGEAETSLPAELLRRWDDEPWPGNVRELRNAVARWLALGELSPARRQVAPDASVPADPLEEVLALDLPLARARQRVIDEFERRYIERVLAKHGGNVGHAAAASGIARRYFQILRNKKAPSSR